MEPLLDTRNQRWAEDKTNFGYRMLAKMGWKEGKGLGLNEDGITTHIRPKRKGSNQGIGAETTARTTWEATGKVATGFNDVLERLKKTVSSSASLSGEEGIVSVQKLDKAHAKRSRSYFARKAAQKNVAAYSQADLKEIFGGSVGSTVEPVETQVVPRRKLAMHKCKQIGTVGGIGGNCDAESQDSRKRRKGSKTNLVKKNVLSAEPRIEKRRKKKKDKKTRAERSKAESLS